MRDVGKGHAAGCSRRPPTREDLEAGDRIIIAVLVRPMASYLAAKNSARAVVPGVRPGLGCRLGWDGQPVRQAQLGVVVASTPSRQRLIGDAAGRAAPSVGLPGHGMKARSAPTGVF